MRWVTKGSAEPQLGFFMLQGEASILRPTEGFGWSCLNCPHLSPLSFTRDNLHAGEGAENEDAGHRARGSRKKGRGRRTGGARRDGAEPERTARESREVEGGGSRRGEGTGAAPFP